MSRYEGQKVAVWGAARSGIAAANLLVKLGASVVLSDLKENPCENLDSRVKTVFGQNVLEGARYVVLSPGIPPHAAIIQQARDAGAILVSEIELAAEVAKAPIVAITGTDGKSTTTEMIGSICRGAGKQTVVVGNIGTPMCEKVLDVKSDGVIVAEVSAFQLWSCGRFAPKVAVVTNIADDHAEYFENDQSAYIAAKKRVLDDMGPGGTAILRADDVIASRFETPRGVERVYFDATPRTDGFGFDGEWLLRDGKKIFKAEDIPVPGEHNVLNALSALAAGYALGLDEEGMFKGLKAFKNLPHRLEFVRERRGVRYIDDSKATNPHASAVGILALKAPLYVITGGYEKGLSLDPLLDALLKTQAHVIVTGATADRIEREISGRLPCVKAKDLPTAVQMAAEMAEPGSVVLLSPAASSYDCFKSYGERGMVFQQTVRDLAE